MEKILTVRNLTKIFDNNSGIRNINFDLYEGEFLGLIGESGSGKSTISRVILGLLKRNEGEVLYRNREIFSMSKKEKKLLRTKIQLLFQSPYSSLNPKYKVKDIVMEGVIYQKNFILPLNFKNKDEYLKSLIEEVGLEIEILEKYPNQLSGGQRQRVGIARALAVQPEILIADECLTALDMITQTQILKLFFKIKEKRKLTCLFISHDLSTVEKIANRVMVIKNGEIIEIADRETLFKNPQHPYTKELLRSMIKI